jgi:serine/threonine-protein kinase RsbT
MEALATATSEIARNALVYAREGELTIGTIHDGERTGVVVTTRDSGPGILNIEAAMRDG